jgi:hypothetical protein
MKKIRGDKPIGDITHICMEISQGNSLCSYLYLKLEKMSCFSFLQKIREQEGRTCPAQGGGLTSVGRERW